VRAKYWPTLGLSDAKRSNSPSSVVSSFTRSNNGSCGSRGNNNDKPRRSMSTNGSVGGGGGAELTPAPDDASPINYADIEGFSDYSSNNEDPVDPQDSCKSLFEAVFRSVSLR